MASFASAFIVLLASVLAASDAPVGGEELRHIKEVYLANRSSIGFGTFRFDHHSGKAVGATEAREGRIERGSTARGFYSFDGKNARYERLYDKEVLIGKARKVGGNQIWLSVWSTRALTDGHVTLMDQINPTADLTDVAHTAQIYPGSGYLFRDLFFPLDLGNPGPDSFDLAHRLDAMERGECQLIAFEREAKLEGREVAHIAFKAKLGRRDYWVDLQRGGVPLQVLDLVDKRGNRLQLNHDDIRDVHGSWLPYQLTLYMDDSRRVDQVVLREADLANPPGRDVFTLEFDKPFRMIDNARDLSYSARKSWSLLSLPSANSPETRRSPTAKYTPPAPAMPGERARWAIASTWLYALGGVFVALVLWRVFGRMRGRAG